MSLKMQFQRFVNDRWVVIRGVHGMWCVGPPVHLCEAGTSHPSFYEFYTFAEAITFATHQALSEDREVKND